MASIPLTTPYAMKSAKLAIAADNFEDAITSVVLTPEYSQTSVVTINGKVIGGQSISTWKCTIGYVQDLAPGGLSRYLLTNEGAKKTVVFTPVVGGPTITVTLTMAPGAIGGEAGPNPAQASVSLVCDGTPVIAP